MIPYGKIKGGSGKIHPHDECYVCNFSDNNINKKKARKLNKKEIIEQLNDIEFDDFEYMYYYNKYYKFDIGYYF